MDIYCPICAEPMDMMELHEIDGMDFDQARAAFFADGCDAVGFRCSDSRGSMVAAASAALADLLGDDIDGIAAMMDDFVGGY